MSILGKIRVQINLRNKYMSDKQENLDSDFIDGTEPLSFGECMIDMFAFPNTIETREVNTGEDGFREDARNIKSYFERSIDQFHEENV